MSKKIYMKAVITILLIFLLIISSNIHCFALGDVTNDFVWTGWQPTVTGTGSDFTSIIKNITSIIRIVGMIISVVTLSFIGIKFMLGSVEEKANYKQTLVPWIVGAVMIYAITFIPTTIYDSVVGKTAYVNEQFLNGYDSTIMRVHRLILETTTRNHEDLIKEVEDGLESMKNNSSEYYDNKDYKQGKLTAIEDMEEILDGHSGYIGNYTTGSIEGKNVARTISSILELDNEIRKVTENIDGLENIHDGNYVELTAKIRRLELAKYCIEVEE